MSHIDPPPEGHAPDPPSKARLALFTGAALLIGVLIVFGAVLPAEYNRDPLGLGKLTGLSRLWMPPQETLQASAGDRPAAQPQPAPFRTDTFEIPLAATGDADRKNALEFKVHMKPGQTLLYSWSAQGLGAPDDLIYDFHGHTVAAPGGEQTVTVSDYDKSNGAAANGSLTAPLEGIHGWYFRNRAAGPVVIRLRLAGYYDLVPGGQEGNLARIQPQATTAPD